MCMSSLYYRYTAYAAVHLQCTLHGTAGTLHFGLGQFGPPISLLPWHQETFRLEDDDDDDDDDNDDDREE